MYSLNYICFLSFVARKKDENEDEEKNTKVKEEKKVDKKKLLIELIKKGNNCFNFI